MLPDNGERNKPKVIPTEWFTGVGNEANGIIVVFTSALFKELGNGKVGEMMGKWAHLSNNNLPDDIEHRNRIIQEIDDATSFIKEKTGFSAEEIDAECQKLADRYKGTKEAPFSVVLGS